MKDKIINVLITVCLTIIISPQLAHSESWIFDELNDGTVITHDGVNENISKIWAEYNNCLTKSAKRGEYETKEEFEKRKKTQLLGCDNLSRIKGAKISAPIRLSYNADNFEFDFKVAKGELDSKGTKYSKGTIIFNSKFARNIFPRTTTSESSGSQAGRVARNGRSGVSRKDDCENVLFSLDDSFFQGAKAKMPISAWYGGASGADCSCTKHFAVLCDVASCTHEFKEMGPRTNLSILLRSKINNARELKTLEQSLRFEMVGTFLLNKNGWYAFEANKFQLMSLENNKVLAVLVPRK